MERVKKNNLRWFFHTEKNNEEFVKKEYMIGIKGSRRGRPVIRWEDMVKEYMHEREKLF